MGELAVVLMEGELTLDDGIASVVLRGDARGWAIHLPPGMDALRMVWRHRTERPMRAADRLVRSTPTLFPQGGLRPVEVRSGRRLVGMLFLGSGKPRFQPTPVRFLRGR